MDVDRLAAEFVVRFANTAELWRWMKRTSGRRSRRMAVPIEDGNFVHISAGQVAAELGRRANRAVELGSACDATELPPRLF